MIALLAQALALFALPQGEPGLFLQVWEVDEAQGALLELLPGQTPNLHGVVPGIDLNGAADFGVGALFRARLQGALRVERPGLHRFRLRSDDGSRLTLAGRRVIDHDGLHDASTLREGQLELERGEHALTLDLFQDYGDVSVRLEWRPPGAADFALIPGANLSAPAGDVRVTSPGKKRLVRPLPRSAPGKGEPLAGMHPSFRVQALRPEGFEPRVGGMDWLSDGRLVLCTWDGEVYLLENVGADAAGELRVQPFAAGLAEPLGLCVVGDEIFVLQKQELTRLVDADGDGRAEGYECVSSGWSVTPNFHEFAFGLVYADGWFHANLAIAIEPGGRSSWPQARDRGHSIRIARDGRWESVAHGLRTPNGIGRGALGRIWLTDNQGDWLPSSKLQALEPGAFYGSRAVLGDAAAELPVTPPVAWLPQNEIGNSPSQPAPIDVGPYRSAQGQMLVGDVTHGGIKRVFVEELEGVLQGTVFRFMQGLEAGVQRLAWGPDGALYVGGVGSTGNWSQSGKHWFGLERVEYTGAPVFELLELRPFAGGVELTFTEPLRAGQGWDPGAYLVRSWRYEATASYGGPKLDEREHALVSACVSRDRRRVFLELADLAPGRVLYLRLLDGLEGEQAGAPWSSEAWSTLNVVPAREHSGRARWSRNDPRPAPNTLTDAERGAGWQLLFDGATLAGWRAFHGDAPGPGWAVLEGTLALSGAGGDLISTETYGDFELSLEWRVAAGGNSGVFFRVSEEHEQVWESGPELQILDNRRHPDGRNPLTSAGANYALHAPPLDVTRPVGRWNRARILARGGSVEYWLNGTRTCRFELGSEDWAQRLAASKFATMPGFARYAVGHIALQDHGDPVAFRNVKLRRLDG